MRTTYNTVPYQKLMEVYQNFSGGLNTVSAPDSMLDSELNDMLNEDIGIRGSLKRRYGLRKVRSIPAGMAQGYFRYYNLDGTFIEFHAVAGQIYRGSNLTPETITGLSSFQATRIVEGVQFNGVLYVATGTKVIQFDGATWSIVSAYAPTTMEMTYVGPNALATDPLGHLQDTTGTVAGIDYIYPNNPTGVVNGNTTVQVYCTKVAGETYEYATQVLLASSTTDFVDPTTGFKALAADHSISVPTVNTADDYLIRVVMRKVGTTTLLSEYIMPYHYDLIYTPPASPEGTNTIHQCNRAIVHGSRLFLFGDPNEPDVAYVSQVNTPEYFPSLFTIEFDNPRKEALNCLVPYRNGLLAFTRTSVQMLTGTSPDDYSRQMLHTDIGCISPYGAAVMKNGVGFLSTQGIFTVSTSIYVNYTDNKAQVQKMDIKIDNIVPQDPNAMAVYEENQLKITFPATKTRLRFYDTMNAWTKDYSNYFDITGQWQIDTDVYVQRNGALYVFDPTVYNDDDYNYTNMWESKYLSFNQPYHPKKLKELQVLVAPNDEGINSKIYVYADEEAVISADSNDIEVDANHNIVWNLVSTNNFSTPSPTQFDDKWEFGDSIFGQVKVQLEKIQLRGRCHRTRIKVVNTEPKENQFIGFAYIFKAKRPR